MEPLSERERNIMALQMWGEIPKRRHHEYIDFETALECVGFPVDCDGFAEREDFGTEL